MFSFIKPYAISVNACTGTDISSTEEVAVKLESVKSKHPQLLVESRIYKLLQDGGLYLIAYKICVFLRGICDVYIIQESITVNI